MIEIMYVVTDVFQLLIIYNFAQRMLIRRYTKMFTYLAWVGIFLAGEIPVCFNNSHMVFTVSNILLIVGLGILYRDRIKKKIVVFLYIAIFILFSECITNFLLNTLSFNDNSNDYFVVGSIISKLIFVLLIQIVILFNRNSNDLDMNFGLWLGALIIPVCSIVIMILVYYLRKDIAVGAEDIAIYMVLLLINYVSVVQFDNIQKMIFLDAKNTLLEQQESYYINQCQRTNELWDGTRRFRHDIKNQYIVEQELLNMGKYEELKEKYRTTISSMVKEKKYSETGNIYVDSLIN